MTDLYTCSTGLYSIKYCSEAATIGSARGGGAKCWVFVGKKKSYSGKIKKNGNSVFMYMCLCRVGGGRKLVCFRKCRLGWRRIVWQWKKVCCTCRGKKTRLANWHEGMGITLAKKWKPTPRPSCPVLLIQWSAFGTLRSITSGLAMRVVCSKCTNVLVCMRRDLSVLRRKWVLASLYK